MPIYEYTCAKCGKLTDVLQKVSDPPPERCSHCGAKGKLTRVVSRTSFVLRGGGWYADLYSSKKPEPAPGEAKDGASSKTPLPVGEGKGEGKSETATETKSSEPSGKREHSGKGSGSSGSKAGSPSKKPKKAV